MKSSTKLILSLSWQSIAYGIGTIGSQIIIYLMLPVLTHSMSKEEYGAISVIITLYAFLNMLSNAGLPSATFRYHSAAEDEQERRLTLGGAQLLFFAFAALPAAALIAYAKPISLLLLGSEEYARALQFLAGYLITDTMNTVGSIILRVQVRPLTSSLHSIFAIGLQMGLAVLFVAHYEMGTAGYWLGYFAGSVIALGIMTWLVRKTITFYSSRKRMIELMRFGFPLIPATLSMTILRLSDRYIVGYLAGLEQVAVYDVGYKIGSSILLLIIPFRTAWIPFAFSISQKPEAAKTYRDVLTYFMTGCMFLILGVIAFRTELLGFLAPDSYAEAKGVINWVAVSHLFLAAYHILSIGPMTRNKNHILVWAALSAGISNILLNFLLIPRMGIIGAAIATLVGYLLLVVLTYALERGASAFPVDWAQLARLLIASGITAAGIMVAELFSVNGWLQAAIKVSMLAMFPAALFLTGFLTRAQGQELTVIVKRFTSKKKNLEGAANQNK